MNTSATQDFLSDVLGSGRIPVRKLAYFQTRLQILMQQVLLKVFGKLEAQGNFTRRELARRIGKKPEQITRWLSYPQNLTLETMSNLLVGARYELRSVILRDLASGRTLEIPERPQPMARETFSDLESVCDEQSIWLKPPTASAASSAGMYSSTGRAALSQASLKRSPIVARPVENLLTSGGTPFHRTGVPS